MKIYTKKGDAGNTSLFGGQRVSKAHDRVEVYGTIDELNAHVGYLRDLIDVELYREVLLYIQQNLFVVGGHIATPPESKILRSGKQRLQIRAIQKGDVEKLEIEIDQMNETLEPMTHFILPGGHPVVSYCHIVRTVCRRAERHCVHLSIDSEVEPLIITYLNRLSDYFFVLARKLAADTHTDEIKWIE